MEIFRALGVDSTLWIHLACFVVSYLALTELVLKPYFRAFLEREKRTVGSEGDAVRLAEEANELQTQYATKARDLNAKTTSFYSAARAEAAKRSEAIVTTARDEATKLIQTSRTQIASEVQKAQATLKADIPSVGSAIASKLAGKDLSL